MAEIKFDDGLVTYTVNGKCDVSFNPTDNNFVERLYNVFEALDKKQEYYKAQVEKLANKREIFDFAQECDKEIREMIDGLFNHPISDSLFGSMSTYAVASGFPVWANLLLAIMDEVDTAFAREQKLTNPRVAKYTAKYHK